MCLFNSRLGLDWTGETKVRGGHPVDGEIRGPTWIFRFEFRNEKVKVSLVGRNVSNAGRVADEAGKHRL